jgi:hypothetical protein
VAIGNAGVAAGLQREVNAPNPFKLFVKRYFFFAMSLVMGALIAAGFSKTVDRGLFHATPPRPLLLWLHGAAFSAWVVLFAAQSGLVSVRKVSVHKLLGWFGAALAATMVVLGFAVTVVMTRFDISILHQADAGTFIAIPFADMVVFGTLVGLAIYWRKRTDLHRRLLFIASCELLDAGVGRFDYIFNHNLFYPVLDGIIVLGMVRDLVVEGRIHRVYFYVLPVMMVIQAFAVYAWRVNPSWYQAFTKLVLGM